MLGNRQKNLLSPKELAGPLLTSVWLMAPLVQSTSEKLLCKSEQLVLTNHF